MLIGIYDFFIEQKGTNRLNSVYVLAPIVSTRVLYFLLACKVSLSCSVQFENNDCKGGSISLKKETDEPGKKQK